jgi:hypothetical protein
MDLGLAFSFPSQDEKWLQKIGIAGLVNLVPFLGTIVVFGWSLEITRRVIRNSPEPLPDWADFMNFLVLGFKGLVIGLVYTIPIFVVVFPSSILSALLSDSEGIVTLVTTCVSCLAAIYALFLALIMPAALGILAETDDIAAAINPTRILALVRAEPASFLVALVGVFIVNFLAGFGVILCFVGLIFTYAYAMAVTGHLYGQAYNQATGSVTASA